MSSKIFKTYQKQIDKITDNAIRNVTNKKYTQVKREIVKKYHVTYSDATANIRTVHNAKNEMQLRLTKRLKNVLSFKMSITEESRNYVINKKNKKMDRIGKTYNVVKDVFVTIIRGRGSKRIAGTGIKNVWVKTNSGIYKDDKRNAKKNRVRKNYTYKILLKKVANKILGVHSVSYHQMSGLSSVGGDYARQVETKKDTIIGKAFEMLLTDISAEISRKLLEIKRIEKV